MKNEYEMLFCFKCQKLTKHLICWGQGKTTNVPKQCCICGSEE
jgi:hypothetical protein